MGREELEGEELEEGEWEEKKLLEQVVEQVVYTVLRCREGGEVDVSPMGGGVGAGCNLGGLFSALLAATKCMNDCWKL